MTPSANADETLSRVEELLKPVLPQVIEWRREIHANPELSNREEETSQLVIDALRSMGIEKIETGVAHHGVVALIEGENPGPCVGLRADMDALPVTEQTGLPYASQNEGVMHACGHDAHTAMLLGAAKILSQMTDEIEGSIKLIFQPAEEGAPAGEEGGASLMVEEGVLENPTVEAIFGQHVDPLHKTDTISYVPGGAMAAVDQFTINVTGKQTHGSAPWEGIDPIVTSAHIVTALQTVVSRIVDTRDTAVVTVGEINGGTRWNIIPETVTMTGTIRTHDGNVRKKIYEVFDRIVTQTAEAHGATAEIEMIDYGPVTWNDLNLLTKMLPTLKTVAGEEHVIEERPVMGGEDFAYFAQERPGLYVFLGVRNEEIGATHMLHTPYFQLDEEALPLGVKNLCMLALNYLKMNGN